MESIGKHERLENVREPISGAYFHGELWFYCPKCGMAFEFFDTQNDKEKFKHIKGRIYQHIHCGQFIDMT